MTPGARVAAAAEILDSVLAGDAAERALTTWARQHRFAGSGDRAAIRDLVFDGLRRLHSSAALGGGLTGRGVMIGLLHQQGIAPAELFTGIGHALPPLSPEEAAPPQITDPAVALDCPAWLMPELDASLGPDLAPVLSLLKERAPVFLRVNMARLARAAAQALLLEDGIDTRPSPLSPSALEVLSHPRRIQHCAAYTGGAVELQDAASQAVADAVPVTDGQRVLDFCAGGGGKSLALAARCPGIWVAAHDVDPNRMSDLPARAARAGAEILRIAPQDIDRHRNFDVVVVDAPCSGSGAWRRAPQGKWALTPQRLEEVQRLQDTILARASGHVRPGGVLAYMTCSVLECENGARVSRFLAEHPAWRLRSMTRLTPLDGGDGFFLALLDRSVTISDGPANTAAQ